MEVIVGIVAVVVLIAYVWFVVYLRRLEKSAPPPPPHWYAGIDVVTSEHVPPNTVFIIDDQHTMVTNEQTKQNILEWIDTMNKALKDPDKAPRIYPDDPYSKL